MQDPRTKLTAGEILHELKEYLERLQELLDVALDPIQISHL